MTQKAAACSISIVVPVYNVAPFLRECLDSLTGQTLRDIEIICVDDCSNDGSEAILDEYAAKDPRITLIRHETNMTAAQSRKDGALASRGEYVLFVDPDDVLAHTACADLLALVSQHPVDVLHFSATVLADDSIPENRKKNVVNMLKPYKGTLRGDRLTHECFVNKRFGFQIWNKLFRGDLCRQAMTHFPDGSYPKAQDLLALFIILFFARSYYGAKTKPYYFYRLGVGVTGGNRLSLRQIDAYAHQPLVVDALKQFLADVRAEADCQDSINAADYQLTRDMVFRLRHYVAQQDIPYAWETMCRVLGTQRLIGMLARHSNDDEGDWAQLLQPVIRPAEPRAVKCVGAFYFSLSNGGAQRVAAMLTNIWSRMGYKVVIFTDAEPSQDDYPYDAVRIVLPDSRNMCTPAGRAERMRILAEAVQKYHIDLYISHAWLYPMLFWDMLAVKNAGAAFYIHTHNIFSMPLMTGVAARYFYIAQRISAMADGVIALSQTDVTYWRIFNPRVFVSVNPMFFDLAKTAVSPLNGKQIIWVGRLVTEKQPLHAVEVFAKVLKKVPDATLSIVGNGLAPLEKQMRQRAQQLGIQDSITFHGFQSDVLPFYQQSDVFLCTSEYEGFSLTILEAQSCGLPVVSYDMPYLPILESGLGSISVPQNDHDAAAEAIIKLLRDEPYRREKSREARQNIEQHFNVDLETQWASILRSAEEAPPEDSADPHLRLMMRTLCDHMQHAPAPPLPLPSHGPCKRLRKKAATFLTLLLIQGIRPTLKIVRDFVQPRVRSMLRKK